MDLNIISAILNLFGSGNNPSTREIKDELEEEGFTDRRVVGKHIEILTIKGDIQPNDKK